MSRLTLRVALSLALGCAAGLHNAAAQSPVRHAGHSHSVPVHGAHVGGGAYTHGGYAPPPPVHSDGWIGRGHHKAYYHPNEPLARPWYYAGSPGYPYLDAPLYPSPVPNVPYQVGATLITNQALAPHEMLYKHEYKALYPPYYYKVDGGWVVTPWGVWSHEDWKLQGTQVEVEYRPHYSIFSMFCPPRIN
ncbi:MAG: hypothetical protein KY476_22230 [Planctomycetes bacterium]|nr:hypothetical protein [Planctomycetota bacterium]